MSQLNSFWGSILAFIPTLLLAIIVFIVGFFLNKIILNIFSKGAEHSKLDQIGRAHV